MSKTDRSPSLQGFTQALRGIRINKYINELYGMSGGVSAKEKAKAEKGPGVVGAGRGVPILIRVFRKSLIFEPRLEKGGLVCLVDVWGKNTGQQMQRP